MLYLSYPHNEKSQQLCPRFAFCCVLLWFESSQFNTLRPRQNGRHFPDDIFKWIFLNENVWISINISLKFVPRGPINNIPTLVQVMTRRWPGNKPLSESMMAYMHHSASMSYSINSFNLYLSGLLYWHRGSIQLPQYQWSNPEEYRYMDPMHPLRTNDVNTTKTGA